MGTSIYRKTEFDAEKAERICQYFGEGFDLEDGKIKRLNLTEVCREVGISGRTLRVWLAQRPDFYNQYRVSLELYADRLVEEALRIAADDSKDFADQPGVGGTFKKPNVVAVNRAKLYVETLLKIASKYNPERYGDSIKINSTSTSINIHIDSQARQQRINNIMKAAKEQGYDTKEIRARVETLLGTEEQTTEIADAVPRLLNSPQTMVISRHPTKRKPWGKIEDAQVQESVG